MSEHTDPINRRDIVEVCGETYTQRGVAYQRSGKVRKVVWHPDEQVLEAQVAGNYRSSYDVEIELYFEPTEAFVEGRCDCPVGFDCKHVAAALLEWIARGFPGWDAPVAGGTGSDLDSWLALQATRDRIESQSSSDQFLLFQLRIQDYPLGMKVDVATFKSRYLKKGGLGKLSPYNLDNVSYYSVPAFVDEVDIRVLRLMQPVSNPYDSMLLGEEGATALKLLLGSGRLFFGTQQQPRLLRKGPERSLTWHWDVNDNGHQLLADLEGAGVGWRILPLSPPWYFDPEVAELGLIQHALPGRDLVALSKLPPIAETEMGRVVALLSERYPAASVPLPVEANVSYFDGAPVPVLTLQGHDVHPGYRRHTLTLQIDYGPVRLPPIGNNPGQRVTVQVDGGHLIIQRQLVLEAQWLERLQNLGLISLNEPLQGLDGEVLVFSALTREASVRQLQRFVAEDLPLLEAEGWRIEMDDSFGFQVTQVHSLDGRLEESDNGWFDLALDIDIDGCSMPLLPLIIDGLKQGGNGPLLTEVSPGRWLEVPEAVIRPILDTLVELYDRPVLSASGSLMMGKQDAARVLDLEANDIQWRKGATERRVRRLGQRLKHFQGIKTIAPPRGLQADLRSYQQQGLNWLQFLREYGMGGILADDMGLGKTLQTLAHLLKEKQSRRLIQPALIVVPTSLLGNWRRESERFTPRLKVLVLHGLNRHGLYEQIAEQDLVITSYALVARDLEQHQQQAYSYLILDEAQQIKNPKSKTAHALRALDVEHRLCLTGTPMENHLGELWSLFDFLMPGFLGDQQQFNRLYRTPIEKNNDTSRSDALSRRLAPFLLRRTKEKVAKELPPKSEIMQIVDLADDQRRLYESIRVSMERKVSRLLSEKGLRRSHIEILDALLKLRQACCDPRLVKLEAAAKVKHSAKLELLKQMLPELVEEGRRILLFSQFTSMLSLIEEQLNTLDIGYVKLTGQTRKRDQAVEAFQSGKVPVFLISLKAGGVGLNLTQADTVILYDPWWNPAAENQAIDRAHRIGQDKPVLIYRLITEGTVEEKVMALQARKQALADGVYGSKEADALKVMGPEDLLGLFSSME